MYESLSLFSEPTKVWFEHAFGQPTEAQAQAKHWLRFSQPSTD